MEEMARAERIRQDAADLAAAAGIAEGGKVEEAAVYRSGSKVTKGALMHKHRSEWKRVREEIADLRAASKRLDKHVLAEKQAKKNIARKIKEMSKEVKERHAAEMAAWEAAAKELGVKPVNYEPGMLSTAGASTSTAGGSGMDIVPMDGEQDVGPSAANGTVSLFALGGRVETSRGAPIPPAVAGGKKKKKKRGKWAALVVDF
ncbi:uncharacterized protein AMSG_12003 [Thecamonas trahens ATCC 50062]|uniref:Uncharacterized protein n=1 Tax=Thecamonas trahens ATCC 50062 TaxID=461836 RepID=A0A0L0DF52_THETB|nr:hypothetical protein AMSG_12003 [Thecamonas trahens ATCC 50062]KNC50771.1 hypothetical protein AMSG_12003 [Thecamonas trahens ATCC 50062]|eukprot:XP_013756825.1 hypothetical protein AMSG_12003 [Thecamonas trahens ATCC 50062]